jgi:hypothetical protein
VQEDPAQNNCPSGSALFILHFFMVLRILRVYKMGLQQTGN